MNDFAILNNLLLRNDDALWKYALVAYADNQGIVDEYAGGVLEVRTISSLRIKKQGEVKNFCRSHPAGPRRIGLAQSSGKSTLPTKE